ncbi:MAG: endoglucanase [Methanobacteriaceae archaeon]|jgi:hypothetical protein|nr:endoglucanase [Candidatus Methanorudis spinitermitis]
MKNSNIVISIIIVLCIAAGVTAYGLINPKDNIFTNLPGFNLDEDSSIEGDSQNIGGGGSGNGGSGSNSGGSGISSSKAKNITNDHIAVEGHYAGNPRTLSNGNWYVPIHDNNGNIVSGLEIDSKTGKVIGLA